MNPFPQLVPLRVHATFARLQTQTWTPAVALAAEATAQPIDLAAAPAASCASNRRRAERRIGAVPQDDADQTNRT